MLDGVMEVAREIASKSPMAIWGTKQTMHYTRDHSVADGLEFIANWNAAMFDTDDMGEAFTAQMEQRKADFPGYHGKGFYSGQGVYVYANNGEHGKAARTRPDIPSGVLAEWDGRAEKWTMRNSDR